MRRVLKEEKAHEIDVSYVDFGNPNFGIVSGKTKMFLQQRVDEDYVDAFDTIDMKRRYSSLSGGSTYKAAVLSSLSLEGREVYHFDTPQELFKWLSE